jgi:hypothetical protein
MARYAVNRDRLPAEVQALADEAGLDRVCRNPFRSILESIRNHDPCISCAADFLQLRVHRE